MKVVLFCGGLGMRLRDEAENAPKPMLPVGHQPILWHLMKYYAHFGHREFILCLGYGGDRIRAFFRNRPDRDDGPNDWTITFVETGLSSSIGQRLRAVRDHVAGDPLFLANYSDGLTDLPLDQQVQAFQQSNAVACLLSTRPNLSYHFIAADEAGCIQGFRDAGQSGLRVNGGFFIFRPQIFDYLGVDEDLVEEPFHRLMAERKLLAYHYDGFWVPLDTAKDRARLDALVESGRPPWYVWANQDRP